MSHRRTSIYLTRSNLTYIEDIGEIIGTRSLSMALNTALARFRLGIKVPIKLKNETNISEMVDEQEK